MMTTDTWVKLLKLYFFSAFECYCWSTFLSSAITRGNESAVTVAVSSYDVFLLQNPMWTLPQTLPPIYLFFQRLHQMLFLSLRARFCRACFFLHSLSSPFCSKPLFQFRISKWTKYTWLLSILSLACKSVFYGSSADLPRTCSLRTTWLVEQNVAVGCRCPHDWISHDLAHTSASQWGEE